MKRNSTSPKEYKYDNGTGVYRIIISELHLLKRQYDLLCTGQLKGSINHYIDNNKNIANQNITILFTEVASENSRITIVPYNIEIKLIDMYISVASLSRQVPIRFNSLNEFILNSQNKTHKK